MKAMICRLSSVLIALSCSLIMGASEMRYRISFAPDLHYINVSLRLSHLSKRKTKLKMPVWAPGDYVVANYPKNLCDFRVTSVKNGAPVEWSKQGKSTWEISNGGCRDVQVTYRIFADKNDLAEASVSAGRAFMPTNGVCMYVDGEKDSPVTIAVQPDRRWGRVTTTLHEVPGEEYTYMAKDVDEMYDSPFLLGNHRVDRRRWDGVDYTFAIETPDGIDSTAFFQDVKKIVEHTHELFGDVPLDHYCFFLLGKGQGGLEHCSSQVCFTDGSFVFDSRSAYLRMLYLVAHEYYHLYNVKRIRPIELGPFDYEHEVFTPSLWVSEGITMYYETEILRRAGIITDQEALDKMSFFIRRIETKEGHRHMSLRQSSYDIWLNFMTDNANEDDVSINFYFKGPIVAMLMDIEIRRMTDGQRSLDDLMRLLYERYYMKLKRGFAEEELWADIEKVAGGNVSQLRRYVDTTDEIDYDAILNHAALWLDSSTWQICPWPRKGIDGIGL